MASVILNGVTYTDDANAGTGMANGGHRVRFVPCLSNFVAEAATQLALQHASRDAADASEAAALASELSAAASALSALNSPGTSATSTTSDTIALGSTTITIQTGKAFVVGQFVSIAYTTDPTQYMHGNITAYNSGTGALTVNVGEVKGSGSYAAWTIALSAPINPGLSEVSSRTTNTILGVGDKGKLINVTSGSFTQTFDAVATLGSNWWCYYYNAGTGTITLDPNASELIDGVTSGTIKPGMMVIIECTGTAFLVQKVGQMTTTEILTSGTTWVCPIGVRRLRVRAVGGGGGAGGSSAALYGNPGGGGAYCERFEAVVPGTTYTYAIGAAGAGGATTVNGTAGGNTTWTNGTTITAAGGALGPSGGLSYYVAGGAATCSGGIAIAGRDGMIDAAGNGTGCQGGDNPLGKGGTYGQSAAISLPSGYGGGGSGRSSLVASTGQNGTAGVIILEY